MLLMLTPSSIVQTVCAARLRSLSRQLAPSPAQPTSLCNVRLMRIAEQNRETAKVIRRVTPHREGLSGVYIVCILCWYVARLRCSETDGGNWSIAAMYCLSPIDSNEMEWLSPKSE
jgi:hypothetical protein